MAGVRRRLAPKAAPSRADSLRSKQRGGTRVLRFGEGGPRSVSRPSPTEPRLPPGQHLQRWERVRGHGQRYAHHDQHSQHDHHGYSQAATVSVHILFFGSERPDSYTRQRLCSAPRRPM